MPKEPNTIPVIAYECAIDDPICTEIKLWASRIVPDCSVKVTKGLYLVRAEVYFEPLYALARDFSQHLAPEGWVIVEVECCLHAGTLLVRKCQLIRPL